MIYVVVFIIWTSPADFENIKKERLQKIEISNFNVNFFISLIPHFQVLISNLKILSLGVIFFGSMHGSDIIQHNHL